MNETDGRILWFSKENGVISADINGTNKRFFVHISKIVSGPEVIKAGYLVKFIPSPNPVKIGMLPNALNVTVSEPKVGA